MEYCNKSTQKILLSVQKMAKIGPKFKIDVTKFCSCPKLFLVLVFRNYVSVLELQMEFFEFHRVLECNKFQRDCRREANLGQVDVFDSLRGCFNLWISEDAEALQIAGVSICRCVAEKLLMIAFAVAMCFTADGYIMLQNHLSTMKEIMFATKQLHGLFIAVVDSHVNTLSWNCCPRRARLFMQV